MDIAKETNATATHVAIAWLLNKAANSSTAIIPILGSRTAEQLNATLGALDVILNTSHISRLDEASAVALGVPHEQIHASAKNLAAGKDIHILLKSA